MEIAIASLVLLITISASLLLRVWRNQGGRNPLPPGPWGIPLLGRLPFLSANILHDFTDLAKSYGPIFSLRLGTSLCVVISSPSIAREALKENDAIFANHATSSAALIALGGPDVVFSPHGPEWRYLRKMAVREILSPSVLDTFRSHRKQVIDYLMGELRAKAGEAMDICDIAYSATLKVIMSMVIQGADESGELGKFGKEIPHVVDGMIRLFGEPNVSDFIPWLAPLDLQGLKKKTVALSQRFDKVVQAIIDHKLKSSAPEEGGARDFIQLMLDNMEKKDSEMEFTPKHTRAMILDIIGGATDTTSNTVAWAMAELIRNPDVMTKAREELNNVVGNDSVLEETHLSKLQYLEAVFKETLRLHPPLPLILPRSTSASCIVSGYMIPAGTRVFVNAWAIQTDPTVWEEPLEFRPERFIERDYKWGAQNGNNFEYLPFGAGRRACAGVSMARTMALYILGSLLHSFDWTLPPGIVTVDVEATLTIVLKKKEPLLLIPHIKPSKQGMVPIAQ